MMEIRKTNVKEVFMILMFVREILMFCCWGFFVWFCCGVFFAKSRMILLRKTMQFRTEIILEDSTTTLTLII